MPETYRVKGSVRDVLITVANGVVINAPYPFWHLQGRLLENVLTWAAENHYQIEPT